jgi:hypothetical protein
MKIICHRVYLRRYKSYFEGLKTGLFVNFDPFPCSWISIPNTNPDPEESKQCGSGSGTLKKRQKGKRKKSCKGTIYLTYKHLGRLKKARAEPESSKCLHFGRRKIEVLFPSVQKTKGEQH